MNRNSATAKKTNETLAFALSATSNIPNSAKPIPLQKGQVGYFLFRLYYLKSHSFIHSLLGI